MQNKPNKQNAALYYQSARPMTGSRAVSRGNAMTQCNTSQIGKSQMNSQFVVSQVGNNKIVAKLSKLTNQSSGSNISKAKQKEIADTKKYNSSNNPINVIKADLTKIKKNPEQNKNSISSSNSFQDNSECAQQVKQSPVKCNLSNKTKISPAKQISQITKRTDENNCTPIADSLLDAYVYGPSNEKVNLQSLIDCSNFSIFVFCIFIKLGI